MISKENEENSLNDFKNAYLKPEVDHSEGLLPTEVELQENTSMLFSDDEDFQSMAIYYFTQALRFVTPEILQRILSFKQSSNIDLIEATVNFLSVAINSSEIPKNILLNQEIPAFLLNVFQNSPNLSIRSISIEAIRKYSENSQDASNYFYEQGILPQCSLIVQQNTDVELISRCLLYINFVYSRSSPDQCDEFIASLVPLYNYLINLSSRSLTISKLTINSIRMFIIRCSDKSVHAVLDSFLMNFISFMMKSPEQLSKLKDEDDQSILLSLFIEITDHYDSTLSSQILPFINDYFQVYLQMKPIKKMTIQFLKIFHNLAANDDEMILSFLSSETVFAFLQSLFVNQPYDVIKHVMLIYSYLAISPNAAFKTFIWENNQNAIEVMIDMMDISDIDYIKYCFQCLYSLLSYFKSSNQNYFEELMKMVLSSQIETIIDDVLESCKDENILALAGNLYDLLEMQ